MSKENDVVIVGAARTPIGKLLGALSPLSAVDLGATALKAALEKSGVAADQLDQVIFGQVLQAGAGQNPARQTAVAAGVPLSVPTMTVNSVCLSGLRSVIEASRLITSGEADVVAAGGQESMSQAPFVVPNLRAGKAFGQAPLLDTLERDALSDAFDQNSMGLNTDLGNAKYGITREEQDSIAAASHQRAAAAWESEVFDAEIAPVSVPGRKGAVNVVEKDEGIRPDTTVETLAKLRPAFREDGTITAGNASQISDGAAAVILARRSWAEEKGLNILATVVGWANTAGPDDTSLHTQPAHAITAAVKRAGISVEDLDFAEINEAFASVTAVSMAELGLDSEKVNLHGGAVAMGHPVGASGARLVVHAAHLLATGEYGSTAAVALCGGGGQGDGVVLKAG
ncbi:acetyl-CoA C-acyltransferase [Rothia aerolata]|uniref:Probable acetyl-CoA acetyltransferase n=1 Tax=Rothia aerolata TaxID=1812262 RepID=A0A917IYC3_9MICC|nr:acetyl-CoA C-acyltransferase [Rothia aerolata]GGH66280.1 acetyl-CoA acetyltransferase [Rothia aerolata]